MIWLGYAAVAVATVAGLFGGAWLVDRWMNR